LRDSAFVKELFLERGLSVTALNNYLTCPWRYFYDSLLLFPKSPSRDQIYGNAVHHTLKDFFDALSKRDPLPDKLFLTEKFQFYLKKEPLTEKDFSESLERGKKTLSAYQDYWHGRWQLPVKTEFNIPGVIIGENIRLTGKLDKIEFLESGINVVDYKTSQPKTRGEIEGETKNSDGNLKRQLVFYKLLLDRFENGRFRMISGEIDFVHPDEKGRFRKEKFVIEKEAVVELENLIKNVTQEILSLAFWDKRCGDKECRHCRLREVMV
jgi:DNA helicase-2/ATP-dependent DNA helicase PcrA